MIGVEEQVNFEVQDALFDLFPYRPWRSPLGTEPAGVHPGDRRVIGRLGDQPVSITDLPPHVVHRADPPGYAHTHQYFERGRDFLDWIANTAAASRFVGAGETWTDSTKTAVAAHAVRAGLTWDMGGNIVVTSPPGHLRPRTELPRTKFLLRPAGAGYWDVCAVNDVSQAALNDADLSQALDSPLNDVCCDGDPFTFEVELTGRPIRHLPHLRAAHRQPGPG